MKHQVSRAAVNRLYRALSKRSVVGQGTFGSATAVRNRLNRIADAEDRASNRFARRAYDNLWFWSEEASRVPRLGWIAYTLEERRVLRSIEK